MGSIANNIQASAHPLKDVLYEKKYHVDYFQREYKWQTKHIEQLLVDLEASFFANYEEGHGRENIADYNSYYLGPIVISEKGSVRSIVDGQQRLTSLTLLLIYLNNCQKDLGETEELEAYIKSKKYGKTSYNIEVPDRTRILDSLYLREKIDDVEFEDESVQNMMERYQDIETLFSEELKGDKLLMFIDWLKEKVVFVEIIAYSDENAYTIFETMNDRGLNLTPTEMLKGFILTNVRDEGKILELNNIWKAITSELHSISTQEDMEFMRAWLRAQYADTVRSRTKGSGNEDFEKIGTKFHTWIKDNTKKIGLKTSESFYFFVKSDLQYYSSIYLRITKALKGKIPALNNLHLSSFWNIATSLSYPLLLAPIDKLDDEATIDEKLNIVSKFIDIYTTFRTVHQRSISQSGIRYSIYALVKSIRNKSVEELRDILTNELLVTKDFPFDIRSFDAYNSNPKFLRYLMARIVYHLEITIPNDDISFTDLIATRKKNRYVVTPLIWEHSYDEYEDQFDTEAEYTQTLSLLGNYLFVPNPVKIVIEEYPDIRKLSHLQNENYLCSATRWPTNQELNDKYGFKQIEVLSKEAIEERTEIFGKLINEIWNPNEI
jgi:uncharacterized protein with ParB-like and HNH nuclease domain